MGKRLFEMTLEELWQLFPIILTEHKDCWIDWYDEEINSLKRILPLNIQFYHIGSTAIKGIMAKPIIDIILAVDTKTQMSDIAEILSKHEYIIMSKNENRISLNKGYTENGFAEKVFHIHIRSKNDIDEIYFRDYLNNHPDIAKEYEALKLKLWKKYEHNRDAYTNAKSQFVNKYTYLARCNKY